MKRITEENLKTAFAGESQAHMRYQLFADRAEREGHPNLARLFRAIAFAERVHANNHLVALAGLKNSVENLDVAIGGETYEVEEMYPAYNAVAKLQQERMAERSTKWALEAEKIHAAMYAKAKKAVEAKRDPEVGVMHICDCCGYTVEGEAPAKCPVCGADRRRFRKF